jgi:hypothetical protein
MPTIIDNTTFDLLPAPQFGAFQIKRKAPKIKFQAAKGYVHQREQYPAPKYQFTHGWNVLTTAQCNLLRAWLDFAGSDAFYYVVPDSEFFEGMVNDTHLVRIVDEETEITPLSNGKYKVSITMEDL